jgi:hypothetical protein
MPAPKKAAINTELSRLIATNPNFAKDVKKYMVKYKANPTTTNAAKTNLLKKKGRMDEAKALIKGGKGLVANARKEMRAARDSTSLNDAYNKDSKGYSLQKKGRYVAVKAAQPYGEAVRTNARVQAQAKKAQAKKTK